MTRMSLALFQERTKAEPICDRLTREGFNPELHDYAPQGALWFTSPRKAGVRLQVPAEQFERAEQFLLDWDAAEGALRDAIRCPQCRSLRVEYPQYAHNSLLTNLAMGASAEVGIIEKDYYCEDCHYTWPKPGPVRPAQAHSAPDYFLEGVPPKPKKPAKPTGR
ncbi:MAG TPA: hypothetical protein VG167_04140 [Verrucomicrobiae bacterium]|nr:hypothetical protein [Verrucomicrobiae bacterium]